MQTTTTTTLIKTLDELAPSLDYSLMDTLTPDPDATADGVDHHPRQVFSGHYVPVVPTPIGQPEYIAHSQTLFRELGLSDQLAQDADFIRLFSGDLSNQPQGFRTTGWATGYALSIYGTQYTQQCPFRTGNAYGDGRAVSVLEAVLGNQRWEMQLKGGGRTPYCRGGDGRAVLRSSVREFLAQEHMHALGVPTTRSLTLYVSKTDRVRRPWYAEGSRALDPDRMVTEPVAITTRVASSFIRVGQLELFARRARKQQANALIELEQLVHHLIEREYADEIPSSCGLSERLLMLAKAFRGRLTKLVANWIRVGYCQGNFNSDNCAAGGFTLDYGPFGFIDVFHPDYQPWTGGGQHFALMNQPMAAGKNFGSFCQALQPLLADNSQALRALHEIERDFSQVMQAEMEAMWAAKLGLTEFDADLFQQLERLMMRTPVDYTRFFRELSKVPPSIQALKTSFYQNTGNQRFAPHSQQDDLETQPLDASWSLWLSQWRQALGTEGETGRSEAQIRAQMKAVNPKYTLREWLLAPAYQAAMAGNYHLIHELQTLMTQPYTEQSQAIAERFYRQKPIEAFGAGGISHLSCSS
ncbi:protein adenylyltransferase SelO [Allopseudospirillum japonicum]|uniref:protein adenylyltransferase SelO n=1 Tax=Allopseudospirillum japonicum TaxID=64971 RepID=UPI001FE0121C|nr:protein adenylyltransferase SelO family protein [Allopseudospirillum japonicum]